MSKFEDMLRYCSAQAALGVYSPLVAYQCRIEEAKARRPEYDWSRVERLAQTTGYSLVDLVHLVDVGHGDDIESLVEDACRYNVHVTDVINFERLVKHDLAK